MNILLSLPPNVVRSPGDLHRAADRRDYYYFDSDPADCKLGSGGGTVWIDSRFDRSHPEAAGRRRIIIHAGGQSRRLPAYAAQGKSMTPMPVLRWAVGEKVDQTLLDMQLPLLKRIMAESPAELTTLVASGDVLIANDGRLPSVPRADVVCFGMWSQPEQAKNHGVFFMPRGDESAAGRLDFMLQKPTERRLAELSETHYYLMDIGLWLLSDRAMELMRRRSTDADGHLRNYDMYSQFGCALGLNPSLPDDELSRLTVAVVPLPEGRFYHFGTTRQLLSSTLSLQNLVADQRRIRNRYTKPNPSLFVQNCRMGFVLTRDNNNVWVENSCVGPQWRLTSENVVTGVPDNDWPLTLAEGQCLDVVPVDGTRYAVRPYGFDDAMRGQVADEATRFLGGSCAEWCSRRGVELPCAADTDIQAAPIFPIVDTIGAMGLVARWMTSEPDLAEGRELWLRAEKISADDIMVRADLGRVRGQRDEFLRANLTMLATNPKSVFYQLDLDDAAHKYVAFDLEAPAALPADDQVVRRIHNHMLRSRIEQLSGREYRADEQAAFGIMRDSILSTVDTSRAVPRLSADRDQIVWGRSPVRIDIAGGWTDTPPYSLLHGGSVVNMAVELNGQPPLQVFVKPSEDYRITLRSIDLGASEVIDDYESLTDYARIGSPFSLPKAALSIAGFAPGFSAERYATLEQQLKAFGSGLELTLLSALPAGSGMGTSSILAATVLGSLSDFCGLGWTADEICQRTLALEQLLTTGGGWQDQYGGVLRGVKLLQTLEGRLQSPSISWLPDGLFTDPEYAPCHILFYTGLTRTAKGILAEIVKRMFLNYGPSLDLLDRMKEHALDMADAIQRRDFTRYGRLVAETWRHNMALDAGTRPEAVRAIIERVEDLTLGLKLPGAGGGGYLYMVAKDPEAAALIRRLLSDLGRGRLAEMRVSDAGFQVSRS